MKKLVSLFLITSCVSLFAQDIKLQQDVTENKISTEGPNRKNYHHSYMGYGVCAGKASDSLKTKFGSGNFVFGYRYKRRFCQAYAIGYDVNYNANFFRIVQDSMKMFPNNVLHKKEKLIQNNVALVIYNRFNFGRRGDYIGHFLDLGAYAEWNFRSVYQTYDEYAVANSVGASNTRQIHSGLTYLNPFNYGFTARIGASKYALYANYRMSDIFKISYIFPELPRLIIGLQLGLHK